VCERERERERERELAEPEVTAMVDLGFRV
jgi:hypothetical protein